MCGILNASKTMQYSLHMQFLNPDKGKYCEKMETKNENGNLLFDRMDNMICEKCKYSHLVYCPINDLICDAKGNTSTYTKKNKILNAQLQLNHDKDILSDRKMSYDEHDEINIEGKFSRCFFSFNFE